MNNEYEYVDRYTALGITPPSPDECCKGQCEGTGVYPCKADDADDRERAEIAKCEPSPDGWYFLVCPTCGGSGHRKVATS